jgi:xanthosine utilization system XapX-like protein
MSLPKLSSRDLWLAFSSGTLGMGLMFVLVSASPPAYKATAIGIGLVGVVVGISVWQHFRRHEVVMLREQVQIEGESCAELTFAPLTSLMHPKLFLSVHGRPIVVTDVWRNEEPMIPGPVTASLWREGVVYPGYLDTGHPLRIRFCNEGFASAVVYASIAAIKE